MTKRIALTASLLLLAGAFASPVMAAGPRASDDTSWPGMTQQTYSGYYQGYRPDSASQCGVYDAYCYYNGRLSLDNSPRNR
jgi:hypothetical protein